MQPITTILNHDRADFLEDNWSFEPHLYASTSYALPSVSAWEEFLKGERKAWCYSSDIHPNGSELGKILAQLQQRETTLLTSTGKSAIAWILLTLLKPGDGVVIFKEGYKSTRFFAENLLAKFGINIQILSVDDIAEFEQLAQKQQVKLVMLETPTNPQTRVIDLVKYTDICKKYAVISVLDNSMAGVSQHGEYPIDIFVLSLSKFTSPNANVMGGAIITSKNFANQIENSKSWGTDVLDPRAAHIMLNGMGTYFLRRKRQSENAFKVAAYLSQHQKIKSVLYPGLASHPDYEVAKTQMKDFGVILSFELTCDKAETFKFIDRCKIFKIAFGSGFSNSLISPAWLFYARTFPKSEVVKYPINQSSVRISCGLEDINDLIADLEQALAF